MVLIKHKPASSCTPRATTSYPIEPLILRHIPAAISCNWLRWTSLGPPSRRTTRLKSMRKSHARVPEYVKPDSISLSWVLGVSTGALLLDVLCIRAQYRRLR